jgi:hypothetical protein
MRRETQDEAKGQQQDAGSAERLISSETAPMRAQRRKRKARVKARRD